MMPPPLRTSAGNECRFLRTLPGHVAVEWMDTPTPQDIEECHTWFAQCTGARVSGSTKVNDIGEALAVALVATARDNRN